MTTRLAPLLASFAACLTLAACGKKAPETVTAAPAPASAPAPAPEPVLTKITVQLDWVAEPEHGGFYQAKAKGFFKDAGLDVQIIPGGPNALVMQKLATGQV